jgi:hypothetical protein
MIILWHDVYVVDVFVLTIDVLTVAEIPNVQVRYTSATT